MRNIFLKIFVHTDYGKWNPSSSVSKHSIYNTQWLAQFQPSSEEDLNTDFFKQLKTYNLQGGRGEKATPWLPFKQQRSISIFGSHITVK